MAKKQKHFISGSVLKEQASIVQKYNRLCAYLGGDNELLYKMLKRIEHYKLLESWYDSFKSNEMSLEVIKANIETINRNKKYDFYIRAIEGSEHDESVFLRRVDSNKQIEKDYFKFKDQPKEIKSKLLRTIIDNPSYRTAKNILAEGMVLMCDKWATKPSYSGYTPDRKDEMKSDACISLLNGIESYDCQMGSSIFAYFTETIKNCYNSYCFNKKIESQKEVGLDFIDNIQKGFSWETYGDV